MIHITVIPGRERQRANPESSQTHRADTGFRVPRFARSRNDEES